MKKAFMGVRLRRLREERGMTQAALARALELSLPIRSLRLGPAGIGKSIHIGRRAGEGAPDYLEGFLRLARLA